MTDRDDHKALAANLAEDLERKARIFQAVQDRSDRWPDTAESLREDIENVLEVKRTITYEVLLGTGGPACGVEFTDSREARVWWQDWFTLKTYIDLDPDAAETLASVWGIDEMIWEDEHRAD